MQTPVKKIALWFRYGPAEHAQLFHAVPDIVEQLSQEAEVHYFGPDSGRKVPEKMADNMVWHKMPWKVDRTKGLDKLFKTLLWILALPFIGNRCKMLGIDAVYIDETVPFTAGLGHLFYGSKVSITVADFFGDVYFEQSPLLRPLARLIRFIDISAWRKLPLIFTRAKTTRDFLETQGIDPARVQAVYDPCDFELYRPLEDSVACRSELGYAPDDLVLVHHGILHPNKGNAFILNALHELKETLPQLRYLLVGDGPDMSHLKELAKRLQLEDRVQFTGWLPTLADVNRALNAGDIGLVMRIGQQSDDFHMTGALVHNMATGLPVLAARLGGVSEVIEHMENGLLFDPTNAEDFKQQLQLFASDPQLRKSCAGQSLADAHQLFDMKRVTQAICTPLLDLANTEATH